MARGRRRRTDVHDVDPGHVEQILERHDEFGSPAGTQPPAPHRPECDVEVGFGALRPIIVAGVLTVASPAGELGLATAEHVNVRQLEVPGDLGKPRSAAVVEHLLLVLPRDLLIRHGMHIIPARSVLSRPDSWARASRG